MSYIPTQEELIAFGLVSPYAGLSSVLDVAFAVTDGRVYDDTTIAFEPTFQTWTIHAREGNCMFYPQSADDVVTLIRLLTPPKD